MNQPPIIDNKSEAGPDYFFCQLCLGYHAPEQKSKRDFVYNHHHYICCTWQYENMKNEKAVDTEIWDPTNLLEPVTTGHQIDENLMHNSSTKKTISTVIQKPKKRGRPQKSISPSILESSKTQEQLAEECRVSQSTISRRIKDAQGVLL